MRQPRENEELATLTHARLRVRQGDYAAASALLLRILELDPAHGEAQELLASIEGRRGPDGGTSAQRRIARLARWVRRIQGER